MGRRSSAGQGSLELSAAGASLGSATEAGRSLTVRSAFPTMVILIVSKKTVVRFKEISEVRFKCVIRDSL